MIKSKRPLWQAVIVYLGALLLMAVGFHSEAHLTRYRQIDTGYLESHNSKNESPIHDQSRNF